MKPTHDRKVLSVFSTLQEKFIGFERDGFVLRSRENEREEREHVPKGAE